MNVLQERDNRVIITRCSTKNIFSTVKSELYFILFLFIFGSRGFGFLELRSVSNGRPKYLSFKFIIIIIIIIFFFFFFFLK